MSAFDFYSLPERYTIGARSKKRTIMPLLSFLTATNGYEYVRELLSRVGCRPEAFRNPDELVSVHFATDILKILSMRGVEGRFLSQIARSTDIWESPQVTRHFTDCRNEHDIFEKICGGFNSQFDSNHAYKIERATPDEITISAEFNKDAQDALRTKIFGAKETCFYRSGTMALVPTIVGREPVDVKITECAHDGGKKCTHVLKLRPKPRFSSQAVLG